MPNGNRNRPPSQVAETAVTRQGSNQGYDEIETIGYSANAETPTELTRDSKIAYLHCWISARVDVAGVGGAPTVVENGFLDVLDRLRVRLLGENLYEHSGRDIYELDRIASATLLDYDDGGFDPGAAAEYELFAELVVPFSLPFMAQPFDFHVRARRTEDEVRQALVRWANDAENAGDDQGTGVLVTGGTQTLTWVREPELFIEAKTVPSRAEGGGDLPVAFPLVETYESSVFTSATSGLTIDFTPDHPVLALLLMGFDDGEPADLIDRVTVADNPDYNSVRVEALRIEERRAFPAVDVSVDHAVALRLADGGRWTNRFRPGMDMPKQRIRLDTSAPGGDGRIRVLAVTGARKNVGRDVRSTVAPQVQPTG